MNLVNQKTQTALAYTLAVLSTACSSEPGHPENPGVDPVAVEPDAFLEVYAGVREQAATMGPEDFQSLYATPPYVESLAYVPADATGLDTIVATYPPSAEQTGALNRQGFVAMGQFSLPTFEHGYADIYSADLPVLVTADSVAYALHRSFDSILMALERSALGPELEAMLAELHADLGIRRTPAALGPTIEDLDVYLTVARSLLTGTAISAVTDGQAQARVLAIMTNVEALTPTELNLFGVTALYDYSQMRPRGHYEDEEVLQRYFKAMMWLGRTEMPMVRFDPEQNPSFHRKGFEAAYALHLALQESGAAERWARIDAALEAMIGEPDNMNPRDMIAFASTLGITSLDGLAALSDQQIYEPLMKGRFGIQRIMSQILYTDPSDPPLLLPRTFLMLGQRFTIDSYVFNNVTYDRVTDSRTGTKLTRVLPDELDVQFVLGSNEAGQLLQSEFDRFPYQGALHELRFLVDQHPEEFWEQSFYNVWLSGIRALNAPPSERDRYPEPMRTQAWAHKTLNTQAASRAELRHDTLLYVKQSYSGGISCEYTGAYVEPVQGFYARMSRLGDIGTNLVNELGSAGYVVQGAEEYFAHWTATMQTLEGIASKELADEALSGDEVEFLGQVAEREIIGCGETSYDGWYPSLFFDRSTVGSPRPSIADVHTAPTDEAGNDRGWVLHAATGSPMMMVMTVPGCDGESAAAFVGPISRYHSVLTENYERLTDSDWEVAKDNAVPPTWTASFAP